MIGRAHERQEMLRCLDAERALCLEGEAGIGKTTVWRAGLELAREKGFRVLVAEPAEAEQSLPYAGLADLLQPVAAAVLPLLFEPQRRALERVLLMRADDGPLDPRAVAVAVGAALAALDAPVLVAVDDVQWLDPDSAAALSFALRRSKTSVLLALRSGHGLPLRMNIEMLQLGPLSVGALHQLLAERLGLALPRTPLLRLHEVSGGNPFYALELARTTMDRNEIVLPPSLRQLLVDRVLVLPNASQRSLAALALGGKGEAGGLAPAVAAGIVVEGSGSFRFAHPLFAEAAKSVLTDAERAALHVTIAEQTSDPETRARHLASAARGPDESVAALLADVAQAAADRGAFAAAAELWEGAARLSLPSGDAYARRLVEAGIAHVLAGNMETGGALLEPNLERLPRGPLRERGLIHLALRLAQDDSRAVVSVLEGALAEITEPRTRYEATLLLANALDATGDLERADDVVAAYLHLAEEQADRTLLEDALLLAAARCLVDDRPGWDLLARAGAVSTAAGPRPRRAWGWAPLTAAYLREGRIDEARRALEEQSDASVRAGSAGYDLGLLINGSIVELAAGNARLSWELADEALAVAEQMDLPVQICLALICSVGAAAVLGEVDSGRRQAERALDLARAVHAVTLADGALLSLALLELSLGHNDLAADAYRQMTAHGLSRLNILAGGRGALDAAEAFVAVGEVDRAADLHAGLPDDAHEKPIVEACVAGARGALDTAITLVISAGPSPSPFRRAREELLLGRLLRRARRKREARVALEAAHSGFIALEAPLWAERAAEELSRIGGRTPVGATLTESERRVAELVASGLSNKEVAARLVVTVRTVEWHLSKVYEKLDVHSRGALAARWAAEAPAKTVDLRSTG